MKIVRSVSFALLLAACGVNEPAAPSPTEQAALEPDSGQARAETAGRELLGQPAARVAMSTIDGGRFELGPQFGRRPVYLKFWATWCVPCRAQMPGFERDYERLKDRFDVVAINTGFNDDIEAVRAYQREMGLTMPIVIDDGQLAAAFNLRVTPQHVVIGRDGRVLYVGHEADERLERALEAAVAELPTEGLRNSSASSQTRTFAVGDQPSQLNVSVVGGGAARIGGTTADGQIQVLLFLSPWCESYLEESRPAASRACRRARERAAELAAGGGVRWLGVASGLWATPSEVRDFQSENNVAIPITLDESGDLFRAFGVHETPTIVLIDRNGRIARTLGPADFASDETNALAGAIQDVRTSP